jgi:hypothetical protein
VVNSSLIDEAMGKFMPQGAMGAMGMEGMGSCPHGNHAGLKSSEEEKMVWEEDAMRELQKIEDPVVREQVRLRVEKRVKMKGLRGVTREDVL